MHQGGWYPKLLHHAAICVVFTIAVFAISDDQSPSLDLFQSSKATTPAVLAAMSDIQPTPSPTPSSTPTPATPRPTLSTTLATSSANRYGIAAGSSLVSLDQTALTRRLAGIKELGTTWVRYDIEWSNIETSPGQYNWAAYDRIVKTASAQGLKSLGIITYTPSWVRRADCAETKMCAPADPAAYGRFAGLVASRYKAYGVHHWEIWNEPNSVNFYQPSADATSYTRLLKAAYPTIKQADSSAVVMTGGTSPAETGDGYLSPPDFISGIYNAGGRGFFDAVAHHPYTFPYTAATAYPDSAWGQLVTIHNIMVDRGDGAKRVWATEYGAPTGGPGDTCYLNSFNPNAWHVDEPLQAKMAADAVAKWRSYSWTGGFFWYSFKDAGTTNDTSENFFGLTRNDGSRKPAYDAYRKAILQ